MMLRLAPHLVGDLTEVEPVAFGNAVRAGRTGAGSRRTAASPGHIGDPRHATAEKGEIAVPRSSPTTWCSFLERVIAWDGRWWDG